MRLALFIALVAAALAWPRARLVPAEWIRRMEARLDRYGAVTVAAVSALVVWFVWGAVVPIPVVHDESSYLLQARLFAAGRWTLPSPPIPEFFAQPHVLVTPALASKYPPGHALVLAPGVLLGFPPLMPLLLAGVTAALLFALVRRVSDVWTALLAWTVWLTAPIVLRFQPTYFSEIATGALLLGAWWCLLEWRATGARGWLVGLALAVGWSAITRPLTALAFAIPIGVVVLRDVAMRRRWLDLAAGVAVGCAVLAILPLWSARTTGSWRESPLARYRLDYMPYDRMGFTVDTTPPRLAVTPVVARLNARLLERHREQTLAELPGTARSRLQHLGRGMFGDWRLPLGALAVVGLVTATAPVWFASASALVVFTAYLGYAYDNRWTLYFLETTPALAALAALGARWLAARLNGERTRASLALMSLAVLALGGATDVQGSRAEHRIFESFDRRFLAAIEQLPGRPAIVFVRNAQRFSDHLAVVGTYPDLDAAPVWVVHDLGPRNEELKRVAPGRATYELSEAQLLR
jgi:hypothetical protein